MPDNQRIQIHQQNTGLVITEKPYPAPSTNQKIIEAQGGINVSENIRLLMSSEATAPLFESIAWGSKPKRQDVEQAGILVGKYYKDVSRRDPFIWGDVVTIIPFDPNLVYALQTSIVIPQNAWARMLDEFVPHLNNGYFNLGWYHTHLGSTNTRFTTVDEDTQKRYYTGEHSFAVVLNPNRKQWSVYFGPRATECVGELFVDEDVFGRYSEHKITLQNVRGDSRLNQDGTITHLNPDGTPVTPVVPPSVTTQEQSFFGWLGEKIFSSHSQRSKQAQNPHRRDFPVTDITSETNQVHRENRPQNPSVEHRPQSVQKPMRRISVRETNIPKIAILPKDNQSESRRMVQATVFVVTIGNPTRLQQQNSQGLQIIEQNIREVVNSIFRDNASRPIDSDVPIMVNAHITQYNDLTLELSLCKSESNAEVLISLHQFDEIFPQEKIDAIIAGKFEIVKRLQGEPYYLFFISKPLESIRLQVYQIK